MKMLKTTTWRGSLGFLEAVGIRTIPRSRSRQWQSQACGWDPCTPATAQYVQMEHVPLCHVSAMCMMDFQFLEQQPQAAPCAVAARAEGLDGLGWTKPSRRSTPVFCVKYIEIRLGTQPYRNHGTLNRKGSLSPNLARLSSPRSSGLAVTRSPSNCPLCAKRAGPEQ